MTVPWLPTTDSAPDAYDSERQQELRVIPSHQGWMAAHHQDGTFTAYRNYDDRTVAADTHDKLVTAIADADKALLTHLRQEFPGWTITWMRSQGVWMAIPTDQNDGSNRCPTVRANTIGALADGLTVQADAAAVGEPDDEAVLAGSPPTSRCSSPRPSPMAPPARTPAIASPTVPMPGSSRNQPGEASGGPAEGNITAGSTPIEDLDLTTRTYRRLTHEGIRTLDDLVARSEQDLLDIRQFGPKSIDEVKQKLTNVGLSLKTLPPKNGQTTTAGAHPNTWSGDQPPPTPDASAHQGTSAPGANSHLAALVRRFELPTWMVPVLKAMPELLTANELAPLFRVNTVSIRRWGSAGWGGMFYTVGRKMRFRRDAILALAPVPVSEDNGVIGDRHGTQKEQGEQRSTKLAEASEAATDRRDTPGEANR